MKYRHCDGKLVLKVTDDQTVRTSLSTNLDLPVLTTLPTVSQVQGISCASAEED